MSLEMLESLRKLMVRESQVFNLVLLRVLKTELCQVAYLRIFLLR